MRVVGAGNLRLALRSLDDIQVSQLVDIPLHETTRFEPTRLANFQSQRIKLHVDMTEYDDYFHIYRIIIFGKMVAVEYPDGGMG